MLLSPATVPQMQAAQVLAGGAMVLFLGARVFRSQAHRVRVLVTVLYVACLLGFVGYVLIR